MLGLGLHHFPIPVGHRACGAFGRRHRAVLRLADRVFRSRRLRHHARGHGYWAQPRLYFFGQTSISDIPPEINDLVYTTVFGVQTNVLTLLALYALAWGYLTYTKGGRTIYAVGSNREAARTAGLDVLFYSMLPYVVSGALSAIAATLMSAQILSIDPLAGTGLELDAIAAVVIGGASLYGGRGTIIGTLIGVFIMVMIRNGLNLLGVSPFWQGSAIGAIIIAAVLAERLLEPARAALGNERRSIMSEALSRGVRLFGTDEPVMPPKLLRAGALSAELEAGNLRYIRFGGVEMIRAISIIVRDKNWGTYDPVIERFGDRGDGGRFPRFLRCRRAGCDAGIRVSRRDCRPRRGNASLFRARPRGHRFSHQSHRFRRAAPDREGRWPTGARHRNHRQNFRYGVSRPD